MNENNAHPLTPERVAELWDAHMPPVLNLQRWNWSDRNGIRAAMRAAYAAGREDALDRSDPLADPAPLDPLADLTPGTVLRDVEALNGDRTTACVMSRDRILYGDWHGGAGLGGDDIAAFTTDDRATRYTRHGDTWTAESLEADE